MSSYDDFLSYDLSQGGFNNYSEYSGNVGFQEREQQFRSAFGEDFRDFSYEAFQGDEAYRNRILNSIQDSRKNSWESAEARDNVKAKERALEDLLNFARTATNETLAEQAGIDKVRSQVEDIFGPLKDEITRLTEQQIQMGRADISGSTGRAADQFTGRLAGTGLGRSGVAQAGVGQIVQAGARRSDEFSAETRAAGDRARLGVDQTIADKQFQINMVELGMNADEIKSATDFRRQIILMEHQTMLQMAANEPSFFEEFAPIFEFAGIATAAYLSGGASLAVTGVPGADSGDGGTTFWNPDGTANG